MFRKWSIERKESDSINMRIIRLLFVVLFIAMAGMIAQGAPVKNKEIYLISKTPTPVLNTPDFAAVFGGKDGETLKRDASGLVREVEFIALPGTLFEAKKKLVAGKNTIYKVITKEYPYPTDKGYYIDARFVNVVSGEPVEREKNLPPKKKIIDRLKSAVGSIYVWGGNVSEGVPEILTFYPPKGSISSDTRVRWELKGLDCTGLLYQATDGFTPRNTSALVSYGKSVPIFGFSADQIVKVVRPLDLIVWKGHVMIVLDGESIIQSRLDYDKKTPGEQGGVRILPIKKVLTELMGERVPSDVYSDTPLQGKKRFVIRRWI